MKKLVAFFLTFSMICAMSATIGCGKTEEKKPTPAPTDEKKKP